MECDWAEFISRLSFPFFALGNFAIEKSRDSDSGEELPLGPIAELRLCGGDQRLLVHKWAWR